MGHVDKPLQQLCGLSQVRFADVQQPGHDAATPIDREISSLQILLDSGGAGILCQDVGVVHQPMALVCPLVVREQRGSQWTGRRQAMPEALRDRSASQLVNGVGSIGVVQVPHNHWIDAATSNGQNRRAEVGHVLMATTQTKAQGVPRGCVAMDSFHQWMTASSFSLKISQKATSSSET